MLPRIDGARLRTEWFGNVRGDLLAGLVVGLALIPESIAFSIIAGVDPKVGLYASFSMAVVIAFAGGRAGMISSATGAMSLVLVTLVRDHGLQYLFATTILTGVFQIAIGLLRWGSLIRFVSRSVLTGFINSMAILVFLAQVPEMRHTPRSTLPMVGLGLLIIYLLPRITTFVPAPLICIVVLTGLSVLAGFDLRIVGDKGELPSSLPMFLLPDIPLNLETVRIILPYAAVLSVVGLLESLLTASILDDWTDSRSSRNREATGQGLANVTTGLLGGMAGCAIIGQSMINIRSGGRGRLSTLAAGIYLLLLVVVFSDLVARIPMAALVAVMITVAIGSFSWSSLRNLRTHPRSSSLVMLTTVGVVVYTHNLAYGVLVGVLLSGVFFAWRVSRATQVTSSLSADGTTRTYVIAGNLFFASADAVVDAIDVHERVATIVLDLSRAQVWDVSGVGALDTVLLKLQRTGAAVQVVGLSEHSAGLVRRHASAHAHAHAHVYVPPPTDAAPDTTSDIPPVSALHP